MNDDSENMMRPRLSESHPLQARVLGTTRKGFPSVANETADKAGRRQGRMRGTGAEASTDAGFR